MGFHKGQEQYHDRQHASAKAVLNLCQSDSS